MIVYCTVLVHVVFIHGQFKGTTFSGTNMEFRPGRYHAVNFLNFKKNQTQKSTIFRMHKNTKSRIKTQTAFLITY